MNQNTQVQQTTCGNKWAYSRDTCAKTPGHVGPHATTEQREAHTFSWFDSEGTPAAPSRIVG